MFFTIVGGEVQVVTDVKAFSMPNFFEKTPMAIGRAVAIFLFAIMLAYCIGQFLARRLTRREASQKVL